MRKVLMRNQPDGRAPLCGIATHSAGSCKGVSERLNKSCASLQTRPKASNITTTMNSRILNAMTTRLAAMVLLVTLGGAAQTEPPTATPQSKPEQVPQGMKKVLGDYGGWWEDLSDQARDSFVDGYTTAMQKARFLTHNECMKNAKSVQPGPEFNAKLQESLKLCAVSEAFDYKAGISLRVGLNRFYNNSLNARIPPEFAMEYVRDEIMRTKTTGELLEELIGWRKAMK